MAQRGSQPSGNGQERPQVIGGPLSVGSVLAAGPSVDVHPARSQPFVDAGQLEPPWPKSRHSHATDRSPRCRPAPGPPAARPSETPTVIAHFGHAGHQRGIVATPGKTRRARIACRRGRKGFGEDAVHDLAGNFAVGEFTDRTAFSQSQFLEFHNLLRFRTFIAKIVKKQYLC